MRCPGCNHDNRVGAKFCDECGHKLIDAGTVAGGGRRRASTGPGVAPELKIVTVVFSDVSGFTSLSETLDPETLRDLMNGWFSRLSDIVRAHGGSIDKFIGDAVMALFGAPVAHEDDPKRAIDAGLAIQAALADYNREVESQIGRPLGVRVGINTGRVYAGIVGSGADSAYTVMGDAVNVAARLEAACPVGSVLVSESTRQHVRGLYDEIELEPLQVKGKSEPLLAFEIKGRRALADHDAGGEWRLDAEVELRQTERDRLVATMDEVRQGGSPRLLVVSAETGMGKRRLVRSALPALESGGVGATLRGRGDRGGAPLQILFDALLRSANVVRSASAGEQARRFEQYLRGVYRHRKDHDEHEVVEWLRALIYSLGLPLGALGDPESQNDPQALRHQAFAAASAWLRGLATAGPLVWFIDEAHRAPAASWELLCELLEEPDLPLLVVATSRASELRGEPPWSGVTNAEVIELDVLGDDDRRKLIEAMLPPLSPLSPELVARIAAHAGGNPAFIVETIRALHQGGLFAPADDGTWSLAGPIPEELPVPETAGQLLQGRVDRLSADTKQALRWAAIAGGQFDADMLEAACDSELSAPVIEECLAKAATAGLLARDSASAPVYQFRSALGRDLVYRAVVARERTACHRRLADRFADSGKASHTIRAAHHYMKAGIDDRAGQLFRRAGDDARRVYANADARHYYERGREALARANASVAERSELLAALGDVCSLAGDVKAATDYFDEALALWEEDGTASPATLAEIYIERGVAASQQDRHAALESYQCAIDLLSNVQGGSSGGLQLAQAYSKRGYESLLSGELDRAEMDQRKALKALAGTRAPAVEAVIYEVLGLVALYRNDYQEALASLERSLLLRSRLRDRRRVASCHLNIGSIYFLTGNFEAARSSFEKALRLHTLSGWEEGITAALTNLGAVSLELDELTVAEELLSNALDNRIEQWAWLPECYRLLAEVQLRRGDLAGAKDLTSRGLECESGPSSVLANLKVTLATVLTRSGEYSRASDLFDEALDSLGEAQTFVETGIAFLRRAELARSMSDRADERRSLEAAVHLFRAVDNQPYLVRAIRELSAIDPKPSGSE